VDGSSQLFSALGLSLPAYLALQALALWKLPGAWRRAAWVILALMVPVFAISLYRFATGSGPWSAWLVFLCPVACFYLFGVFLIRWLVGASARA
jgi:hypothetical protein